MNTRMAGFLSGFLGWQGCAPDPELDDLACLSVELGEACPTEAKARNVLVGNRTCENPVREVIATGAFASVQDGNYSSSGGWFPLDDTGVAGAGSIETTRCCYEAAYRTLQGQGCVIGRPLRRRGVQVTAGVIRGVPWGSVLTPRLDVPDRPDKATSWTRIALLEHASVVAFFRLQADLVALGAPAELVKRAGSAARDEVRHAAEAFGLASAYAGVPIGPTVFPPRSWPRATLRRLAVESITDGCVGEALAVAVAATQWRGTSDPAVANVLARVIHDEANHAALGADVARWAIRTGGPRVRRAAMVAWTASKLPEPDGYGLVADSSVRAALGQMWDEVVRPAVHELLAA